MFILRLWLLVSLQLLSTCVLADLSIISSTGVSSIMQELIPAFERESGHRVTISYNTSNIIMDRLKRGDAVVVLSIVTAGDQLVDAVTMRVI